MITHTSRADPIMSASPSSSRQPLSQPKIPITPNRYRAPPSLDQRNLTTTTPTPRRTSIVGGADVSPSSKSSTSTSNWQSSIELSLTTRRRLVRKPLPQLPSSKLNASETESADDKLIDSAALDSLYRKAESWWPDALPDKQATTAPSSSRFADRIETSSSSDGQGLDEQSLRHLLTILHYAALRDESKAGSVDGDGTIGRNVVLSATGTYKRHSAASIDGENTSPYVLDEATLDSLYHALQAAFRHLSQRHVLSALQRTASIRWRAEVQLRNASAAQAAEANTGLSSRWARFAWPASALGKAYKEAQKSIVPSTPGEGPFSGFTSPSLLQMNHDLYAGHSDAGHSESDHRIRKRDVAVKILSNAIWFVRNYGPDAGVETVPGSAGDLVKEEQDAKTASPAADALVPPSLSSNRRISENLLKKNAGLPLYTSKSSATTALSGTATPESAPSDAPLTPASATSSAATAPTSSLKDVDSASASATSQMPPRLPSTSALNAPSGVGTPRSELGATASSETAPTSTPAAANGNHGEKSKAMEHLASLSAAAGAAMKQRAQQAAAAAAANGTAPEDSVDATLATSTGLRPQSSRPSLRSFPSRSEAEEAESNALEKAERDYLAKIGQSCDEWAKMVVCRLCASISVADTKQRRRSGTLTARDFNQAVAAAQEMDVGSSISTRSDMTAKAGKVGHGSSPHERPSHAQNGAVELELGTIAWKADVFDGEELFAHHGTSSHDRRPSVSPHDEDERVRLVGGSFVCRVQNEKQRQALTELLEIALYVGMSMLLEASFLCDSDAARPKLVKVPTRTTSNVDAPQRGASLIQQPNLSRASSHQSIDGSQRSVSGSSSTQPTSNHTEAAAQGHDNPAESDSAHAKPGARKWTKSLWGKLGQHPNGLADSTSSARPGISDGHEAAAPRKSLTMHRYHTEDDANSLLATANRKALFKAGEEPKQTIAARKAALFANSSNNSAPATPSGGRAAATDPAAPTNSKPNRLVGRLMNAFARPSSSDPPRMEGSRSHLESDAVSTSPQPAPATGIRLPYGKDAVTSRSRAPTESNSSIFPQMRVQPQLAFPLYSPGPAALSTSPELSMLLCYQYRPDPSRTTFATNAYLTAFHRMQLLRFLADQRRDQLTFASPSHGISSSGDLLPFVGVQTPSSLSPWSVILSRGQQQQQQLSERVGVRPVQLLSYELLSSDGSAVGLSREEVAFYQRLSNNRDVPLGQLIEELAIRACATEADHDILSKTDSRIVSGKSQVNGARDRTDGATAQRANGVYGTTGQHLQFVHGSCRIKLVATILPSRLYDDGSEAGAQHHAGTDAGKSTLQTAGQDTPALLRPTNAREADVSAIAAASHTDKEAANTAFAVAETAVQAAERGASQSLVDQKGSGSASGIWMWNASAKSGWQGKAAPMSESTYLLSFARYLEAISYHPALRRAARLEPANAKAYGGLSNVKQQLRQGRSEDDRSVAEGPDLLRLFQSGRSLIKVQVQPLVLYDLHIQGPCLKTTSERRRDRKQKQVQAEKRRLTQLTNRTRLEIQHFFVSLKRVISRLEDVFMARDLDEEDEMIRRKSTPYPNGTSVPAIPGSPAERLELLANLRSSLRTDEFELYEALQRTFFLDGINDVRKAFADRAKSAKNRVLAWRQKHLAKQEQTDFGVCIYDEPEYFETGCRAFPGSCFVIRDDEPLSIIAYSLSSRDFRTEMGTLVDRQQDAAGYMGSSNEEHVKQWRTGVVDGNHAGIYGSRISTASGSTDATASSLLADKSMRNVPFSQLDPDADEVFFDAEPVRAALKRKKRGRESSILSLTLRRVGSTISESQNASYRLKTANSKPSSSAGSVKEKEHDDDDDDDDGDEAALDARSSLTQSSVGAQDKTLGAPTRSITPSRRPSAGFMDQPTSSPVRSDMRTSGSVSALRRTFELRSQSSFSSIPDRHSSIQPQRPGQYTNGSSISTSSTETTFQAQVTPLSGRPASLASIFSSDKPGAEAANSRLSGVSSRGPGLAAPTAIPRSPSKGRPSSSSTSDAVQTSAGTSPAGECRPKTNLLSAQPSPSEGVAGADAQSMISHSTLPGSQAAESPHIKHNVIHGSTKISCVSWFAEEFAALRERWGVEHDYVQSLSRCQPWVATGGKSKSAFFKTADERFIAKQLLTVWSVDEKEAFLEFAPAYIRYMMNSAINDCPTLLVKIAGVYSIKIKDVKSGETKLKMNVMLLENLWAGDGGKSVRFDLKGIRDRKVKLSAQQQQDLQQAATHAAATGQPTVDVPGTAKGAPAQGSATTAMIAGMMAAADGVGSSTMRGGHDSQTSPSRNGDDAKSSSSSAVWWDSEWIERYRHRAFVPETQKETFFRALQNDTQFLTASNVMDYSLLLGVNERPIRTDDMYPPATAEADLEETERPSFRCRIVDFLGAFTLAKQLESSSKKALKGQDAKGNVTILPPSEYASRFLSAMDSYFIGTPCQPRLDKGYGFDRMCEEVAAAGGDGDGARRPGFASVL